MRAVGEEGGAPLHQALTSDAATVVKQAVCLAKRQGHTQITPLHLAAAMLSSSPNLLRTACRKAHSHPLQCKALELCFNVALNRLPTFSSTPLFPIHRTPHPSFSNALLAAFKRAQAHQRRGSVENHQHPILALKIEIEQLVVSILDDPGVSRVMREAGFSSPQLKANVEQVAASVAVVSSLHVSKEKTTPAPKAKHVPFQFEESPFSSKDDAMRVVDMLTNEKRTNSVIIGDCIGIAEGVARNVLDMFQNGDIPRELRFIEFVKFPLRMLENLDEDGVEQKLDELKGTVRRNLSKEVVLYLGDLKWVSECWLKHGEKRDPHYCAVENMVMELRRLVRGGRVWLMGIATFKTYMTCKNRGHGPSLEMIWELHPIAISPSCCSLDLSLGLNSNSKADHCCEDCLANSESNNNTSTTPPITTNLPYWLQQCKESGELGSRHDSPENTIQLFPSSSPASSISIDSYDQNPNKAILGWTMLPDTNQMPTEQQFWTSEKNIDVQSFQPSFRIHLPDLLSNPNSSPNSASSSEAAMEDTEYRFKDTNSKSLEILCDALGKKVPWQKDIIPVIASTVLHGRSGMLKIRGLKQIRHKEEVWLLFLGPECAGKEKIGKQLGKLIFGSLTNSYVSISLSSFSSTKADSSNVIRSKRSRNESGQTYIERFAEAVCENPHRVFFLKDIEQVDRYSQIGIKKAICSGYISTNSEKIVHLEDAITIFSCKSLSSVSRACSPPLIRPKSRNSKDNDEESSSGSLDLNVAIEEYNGDDQPAAIDIGFRDIVDKEIIFKVQQK